MYYYCYYYYYYYYYRQRVRVITVVRMLWAHKAQPSESTANFDHCDDAYRCR